MRGDRVRRLQRSAAMNWIPENSQEVPPAKLRSWERNQAVGKGLARSGWEEKEGFQAGEALRLRANQPTNHARDGGTDLGVGQVTTSGLSAWVTGGHRMLGDQDEQSVSRLQSRAVTSVKVRILRG